MGQGDINVTAVEAFDPFSTGMDGIVTSFTSTMKQVANNSASPAAAGTMDEGKAFMANERQARELLVRYMTATSQGLTGYRTAVSAIGQEYKGLLHLTNGRMQALLRPQEGPASVDPVFDWQRVVAAQLLPAGKEGN
ncbi:MAG: hypothetical protein QOG10_3026 [Kribbellaceae bacterium]|jgi:hypothetical protein|nr:hypothetical protein [Kribbellaceae bacterium]